MTRSGFGLLGLPSVAMVRSSDGLREQVVYLSPDSQALLAAEIAANVAADALPSSSDEAVLLASAVRAADTNTADQTNTAKARGVLLILDVTAVTALQTLTLNLQVKDPASGKYLTLSTTTAIGGTATLVGTYALITQQGIGNGLPASLTALSGSAVILPYTWRAQVDHSGAGNFTYSLGRVLLH